VIEMGAPPRTAFVEAVRVPAERHALALLEHEEPAARAAFEPQDGASSRRQLQATALQLTDTMAPAACASARTAMSRLGASGALELYQNGRDKIHSARLALHGDPLGIEFLGGYLASLDEGGLLAVMGHEIGHGLAHTRDPAFAWALFASQCPSTPSRRLYSLAAELTADRFGLLACRDLDAVLRLEMCGVAGKAAAALQLDTRAYLDGCRRVVEETLASGGVTLGSSHPEHCARSYAEWLFSETDLYAELTGAGSAARTVDEVNAVLASLLGIRGSRPSLAPPAEPEPRGAAPAAARAPRDGKPPTLEALALDILADGARRGIVSAAETLRDAAQRAAAAVSAQLGAPPKVEACAGYEDPLEAEDRELQARFDELERRGRS
jgi:hypothetical protein